MKHQITSNKCLLVGILYELYIPKLLVVDLTSNRLEERIDGAFPNLSRQVPNTASAKPRPLVRSPKELKVANGLSRQGVSSSHHDWRPASLCDAVPWILLRSDFARANK